VSEAKPFFLEGFVAFMRERLHLMKVLILAVLTVGCVAAYMAGWFSSADNTFYDFCLRHRPAQYTSPKIVIVEINEEAIQSVGRWPWDREWHATLIQALKDSGARAIALDMLFSEKNNPATDDLLARVIEKSKITFLPVGYEVVTEGKGSGLIRSIPAISSGAAGEGHTFAQPDPDSILRRTQLYLDGEAARAWNLGLLLALESWGLKPSDIRVSANRLEIPIPGNAPLVVPMDAAAGARINWPARWKDSFRHVSYVDVIQSYSAQLKGEKPSLDPTIFKDAICIVGVTAAGLFDIYATPLESSYPTVGITASILNSLLERSLFNPISSRSQIAIILLLSIMILIIMMRTKYLQSLFLIGVLGVGFLVCAFILFTRMNVVMSVIYPMLLILSGYAALAGYHQIMITVEKSRLLKLATTDPLTNLFNVGHFKRLLDAELQSTRLRSKKDICLVMVDGDHFKKVNDTYGHAVGDDVLRGLSEVLRTNCRALDVAARYGGEEFIVMLPGATLDAGLKVAEKMRAGVEEKKYHLGSTGSPVHFTASFGVAYFVPGESMESFLKRADEALYLAKKTGRNCVCTV
jgi:diguanylate cyclase (GGDEF)-like protein